MEGGMQVTISLLEEFPRNYEFSRLDTGRRNRCFRFEGQG